MFSDTHTLILPTITTLYKELDDKLVHFCNKITNQAVWICYITCINVFLLF